MNYMRLEQNIIDVIEEQQIKLGYLKETVRLYYPLSSLNRFLGTQGDEKEMVEHLRDFSKQVRERFGEIRITGQKERFCIAVPPEGVEYIHAHISSDGFLADLVKTVQKHGCTIEEVLQQFYRHSDHVHVEKTENGEFDYLAYFENGVPDDYRYCLKEEGHHIIYHRYVKEDYEDFGF